MRTDEVRAKLQDAGMTLIDERVNPITIVPDEDDSVDYIIDRIHDAVSHNVDSVVVSCEDGDVIVAVYHAVKHNHRNNMGDGNHQSSSAVLSELLDRTYCLEDGDYIIISAPHYEEVIDEYFDDRRRIAEELISNTIHLIADYLVENVGAKLTAEASTGTVYLRILDDVQIRIADHYAAERRVNQNTFFVIVMSRYLSKYYNRQYYWNCSQSEHVVVNVDDGVDYDAIIERLDQWLEWR